MQHVKDEWLNTITRIYAASSVVLLIAGIGFSQLGIDQGIKDRWGITPFIMVLCGLHLIYFIAIYPFFKKHNAWLAGLISCIATGFIIAALIETSMQGNNIYRAANMLLLFSSAMLGIFPPIAIVATAWLLFIFTVLSLLAPSKTPTPVYFLINIAYTVSAVIGWRVFRKYYVATGNESALENRLEAEEFKTSTILESITDGVLVIDMKNIVQISNASAAQMLGWTKEEAIGLDYHSLLKPITDDANTEEDKLEAVSQAMTSGESTQKVSKLETLNKRQVFVDIVASPIYQTVVGSSGSAEKKLNGIIAVLRDVDKQKRDEQQRSDFISTASHEMRTPVASIQGYLELALNPKISQVDEKTKGYLDKAYEATKHLGQLFQDLLTVSQTEDGRLTNHPTIIDVNKLLTEVCEGQKRSAEKHNLALSCNLHSGTGGEKTIEPLLYVKADPERLREVITNLVENAIKYTPTGKITISSTLKEETVLISVKDTGTGIAEEDISHLFQKFYRVDNSATREIGGTGLGLYLARQIIEMLDGKIWVESKLGEGSDFLVELPRVEASEVAQLSQSAPTQAV